MPIWSVLFIMLGGCICLALGLATIVVPMTMVEGNERWLWIVGLVFATAGIGTLYSRFLSYADRAFGR